MSYSKRQKKREQIAKLCDGIGGKNSQGGRQLRSKNRIVEKSKKFKN